MARALADQSAGRCYEKVSPARMPMQPSDDSNHPLESLPETDSLLGNVLESVPDAVFVLDNSGHYAYVNTTAARMLGRRPEDMIGRHIGTEFPEGVGQPFYHAYHQAVAAQASVRIEKYYPSYDRWFESRIHPGAEGVSVFFHDITGRKTAEEALQQSEAKFRSIIDVSPVPYCLSDDQQNITFLNAEFVQTFGYTLEDIPTLADWWPKAYPDPDYRQWVANTWQTRLEESKRRGTTFEALELSIRCKDGTTRTVMARAAALEESFGGTHLVILYDVTRRKRDEETLRESEQRFRLLAENSSDMISRHTPDGLYLYVSPAARTILGHAPEEMIGRSTYDFFHPDDLKDIRDSHSSILEAPMTATISYRIRHRDGHYLWVETTSKHVTDPATGGLKEIHCASRDITPRRQAEERLRAASARFETLIARLHAGVLMEDEQRQVVLANQKFCDMMSLTTPPEALAGANAARVVETTKTLFSNPDGFTARIDAILKPRQKALSEELPLVDGRVFERDGVPIFLGDSYGGHLWLYRDVSTRHWAERKLKEYSVELERQKAEQERINRQLAEANARLEMLATTDGLTGLRNQRVFEERLAEECRRARRYAEPLSLIILDVDQFKAYNDSYGHLAGNVVLKELAQVLQEYARETDLVARFGGEEFALILPHTEIQEATALAERLRAAAADAGLGVQRSVTASFGVCELVADVDSPEALVAGADAAMYRAKRGGRNQVSL